MSNYLHKAVRSKLKFLRVSIRFFRSLKLVSKHTNTPATIYLEHLEQGLMLFLREWNEAQEAQRLAKVATPKDMGELHKEPLGHGQDDKALKDTIVP
jgi:hypothetical protein